MNTFKAGFPMFFTQTIDQNENEISIEFTDCEDKISVITMPDYLIYIDIPDESIQKILKNANLGIDFDVFANLATELETFRDRIFAMIEAINADQSKIDLKHLSKYLPQKQNALYGYYTVNLANVHQWGLKSDSISFQLRVNRSKWMTYLTNSNKTKTLLLKKGNYYLRINDKVRQTFIISEHNQKLSTVIK